MNGKRLGDYYGDRLRFASCILGGVVLLGTSLRVVLYILFHAGGFSIGQFALSIFAGTFFDGTTGILALLPILLGLTVFRLRVLGLAWLRWLVFETFFFGLAFYTATDYFFFEEFNARFNHIALDYLLHPKEVFINIWESYDVPLVVVLSGLVGALLAFWASRRTRGACFGRLPWAVRWRGALALFGVAIVCATAVDVLPAEVSANRVTSEVAQNGLSRLVHAFRTAELDFNLYYKTLPVAEARTRAAAFLGFPLPAHPDVPEGEFRLERTLSKDVIRQARNWDVVVIVEESLGSEFIGVLGHPERRTSPGFDRWSRDGLLLSDLMATGNRTVRGLEGTLCSFVPLPGDSVLKRKRSENVLTLGRVLRHSGYRTCFLYGGSARFDEMKPFLPNNGFDEFIERGDFPEGTYSTIWGVADEYILGALLDRQKAARAKGEHLFATALTVSNHKPYDVPERGTAWPASQRCRESAVAYADWALADYLDKARAEGLLDHTVVLIVGDHGARVYGSEKIPAASYRIPGLFLVPGRAWAGRRIERVCSQIDLAPTLLALAAISSAAPFLGEDITNLPSEGGRAFLHHNRDFGILTDTALVVLGLQQHVEYYRRSGRDSDQFTQVPAIEASRQMRELEWDAIAVFQTASELYESRHYNLPPTTR